MRSASSGGIWAGLVSLLLASCIEAKTIVDRVQGRNIRRQNAEETKSPALDLDFPDPSIIKGPDQWYAFATASGASGKPKLIQYAIAPEPTGPWTYVEADLLRGNAGNWTDQLNIWAPDVRMVDDGTYVLYYTGTVANNTRLHCLGVATAAAIEGPWQAGDEYWHCDEDRGGSIDSSGFQDGGDGTRYVAWKIDGNALGNGGECGNTVEPIQSTPIMLQQVAGDGITKIGDPVQILDRTDADGPLVEAPNLVQGGDGRYVLFYSSYCFNTPKYNVLYATASNVEGPYTRAAKPLLETGSFNLTSPGGATSTIPGKNKDDTLLFHASCPTNRGGSNRCMFVANYMETNNGTIVVQ
ncbi:unnamed protein product [Discula destructiva]